MSKSTKGLKAAVTAPAFVAASFVTAGFNAGRADTAAIALIKSLAEKNVKAARTAFMTGFLVSRLDVTADTVSAEAAGKAEALMALKGFLKTDPAAAGRRTKDQETLVNTAARAWSRLTSLAGIQRADNRGRKEGTKIGPTKAARGADTTAKSNVTTLKIGKTETAAQAIKTVHAIKTAWAALMTASKGLKLDAEALHIAGEVAVQINRFEAALAKSK